MDIILDISRHIWVSYMFLNGYNSVTLNQMGLIQDGENCVLSQVVGRETYVHISFSTTRTAGVQFEASKRRGKGVKSSGGWQSRRTGWIDMELAKSVPREPCTFS